MTNIVRIDADTDIAFGITTAAEKLAAEVPEAAARQLVKWIAIGIFSNEYIKESGHADELTLRDLRIFREAFSKSELPTLSIILSNR